MEGGGLLQKRGVSLAQPHLRLQHLAPCRQLAIDTTMALADLYPSDPTRERAITWLSKEGLCTTADWIELCDAQLEAHVLEALRTTQGIPFIAIARFKRALHAELARQPLQNEDEAEIDDARRTGQAATAELSVTSTLKEVASATSAAVVSATDALESATSAASSAIQRSISWERAPRQHRAMIPGSNSGKRTAANYQHLHDDGAKGPPRAHERLWTCTRLHMTWLMICCGSSPLLNATVPYTHAFGFITPMRVAKSPRQGESSSRVNTVVDLAMQWCKPARALE